MSPNLPDGLKQQITLPLVAHEADISGTKWNVWTTAGGITMQCCANSYGFFYSSVIIRLKHCSIQNNEHNSLTKLLLWLFKIMKSTVLVNIRHGSKWPQIHSRLLLLWFLITPYGSLAIKPAHIIVFIALFSECAKVLPPQACRLPLN